MSIVTEEMRAMASEIYHGRELCQKKSKLFLEEMGFPSGLLPLEDIEECGQVKETGFIWMKQKQKTEHKFEKIGKVAQYAKELAAFIEPKKMKVVSGLKTKELFMWFSVSEAIVDDPPTGKITFKTSTGLSRAFPISAFMDQEFESGTGKGENGAGCEEIEYIGHA